MRELLYIAMINPELPGVTNKIFSTISYLSQVNPQTKGFLISASPYSLHHDKNITILCADRYKMYAGIEKFITRNYAVQPIIYFRYHNADYYLLDFVKKYGANIVFEHNSMEEIEFKSYFRYYKLRDFLYNLKHFNFSDIRGRANEYFNEVKYGTKVLKLVKGGICVSTQFATYENKRAQNSNYTIAVLGNAIYREKLPEVSDKRISIDGVLRCIFLAGHTNNWHGIDRVLRGISNYKGALKIELIYAGKIMNSVKKLVNNLGIQENVKFEGVCNANQIQHLIKNCNIGISSLGMHRLSIKQRSVLKTLEYLSYGLPTLLSYEEEEIEADEIISTYLIKVSSNETAIDFETVIEKLKLIQKSNYLPKDISEQAMAKFGIKTEHVN